MDTSKWQVETEKDPDRPGALRVAVDGYLTGSVERPPPASMATRKRRRRSSPHTAVEPAGCNAGTHRPVYVYL